jgi:hypothetical protein
VLVPSRLKKLPSMYVQYILCQSPYAEQGFKPHVADRLQGGEANVCGSVRSLTKKVTFDRVTFR